MGDDDVCVLGQPGDLRAVPDVLLYFIVELERNVGPVVAVMDKFQAAQFP